MLQVAARAAANSPASGFVLGQRADIHGVCSITSDCSSAGVRFCIRSPIVMRVHLIIADDRLWPISLLPEGRFRVTAAAHRVLLGACFKRDAERLWGCDGEPPRPRVRRLMTSPSRYLCKQRILSSTHIQVFKQRITPFLFLRSRHLPSARQASDEGLELRLTPFDGGEKLPDLPGLR